MLAQLGHIAPIGVNAHGHIEFEPTHKHSHAEPKDIWRDSDHRHFE